MSGSKEGYDRTAKTLHWISAALFIGALSFTEPVYQEYAKIGIIGGSLLAGIFGYAVLRWATRHRDIS